MMTEFQDNRLIVQDYMDALLTDIVNEEPQISEEDRKRLEDLFERGIQGIDIPVSHSLILTTDLTTSIPDLPKASAYSLFLDVLTLLRGYPEGKVREFIFDRCEKLFQRWSD